MLCILQNMIILKCFIYIIIIIFILKFKSVVWILNVFHDTCTDSIVNNTLNMFPLEFIIVTAVSIVSCPYFFGKEVEKERHL